MVDEKLVNNIVKDLELCTKTAVALAQKLDNLNKNLNELFKSLNVNVHIESIAVPKSTPTSTSTPEPATSSHSSAPAPSSTQGRTSTGQQKAWDGDMQKEGIASVLNKIGKMIAEGSTPEQVADEMERARDSLMSIAKSHSPVFSEMGRKAREIRNLKEFSSDRKGELEEILVDWRTRLVS